MQAGQLDRFPGNMLFAGFLIALKSGPVQMAQVLRHQHSQVVPNHLFRRIAKHLFDGGVYKDNKTAVVDRDDRVGSRFRQSAKAIFTLAQRLLLSACAR
jgi:hypothetical protein